MAIRPLWPPTRTWTPTLTVATLPAAVKSVGTITCPTTTLCESLAVGDSSSATDATVITGAVGPTTDTWSAESNFPTGSVSVTGISCTSSTCIVSGTSSGSPVTQSIWTADLTQGPHAWAAASNFPTVAAITGVACGQPSGSDTADCVVAAAVSGTGELVIGSLNGSWSWNPVQNAGRIHRPLLHRSLLRVGTESQPCHCAAVGATSTGPIIVTSSNGAVGHLVEPDPIVAPRGGRRTGSRGDRAHQLEHLDLPGGLVQQRHQRHRPAQRALSPAARATSSPPVTAWPPLHRSARPRPRSTPSPEAQPRATVPLDVLPLQVTTSAGVPLSGATVTLTTTSCSTADKYTLPATDANGLTTTAVPFGTYTYTVTTSAGITSQPTVTIGGVTSPSVTLSLATTNFVGILTKASNGTVSTVNTYLPGPIVVRSS